MALAACGAPDGGSARESNTFAAKKGMDAWQIHGRRADLAATALWGDERSLPDQDAWKIEVERAAVPFGYGRCRARHCL